MTERRVRNGIFSNYGIVSYERGTEGVLSNFSSFSKKLFYLPPLSKRGGQGEFRKFNPPGPDLDF
jgi:hypothetical protein